MNHLTYGSVCSGIEAATVAWHPLGWQPAWFSEIESFPSAVLAHHYPEVPNLGDMLVLPAAIAAGVVGAPDILCGGTPCQAFSVAGLRRSLDDARGNLSLTFCEIANAIDTQRADDGAEPCIVFWENVPGVLNTKDNAFGCFLAGLAGEDDALQPPGGRWSDAGLVLGPARAVAWRTLDAQFFGLAQRRRRVFVVASARNDFDPGAVLLEFDGVRRDLAPSRGAGEDVAGGLAARAGRGFNDQEAHAGQLVGGLRLGPTAYGGNNQAGPIDVATARNACASASGRMDFESETFLVQPVAFHHNAQAAQLPGPDRDTSISDSLTTSQQAAVAVDVYNHTIGGDLAATLNAESGAPNHSGPKMMHAMQVRRLTPRECERLQGFPDDYTLIPHRGKPAADGPRYKALGNSWAVPVVRWIGRRIAAELFA